MKIAVLKGNRFNPWHLAAFTRLGVDSDVTAFRADSEIQQYFSERGADESGLKTTPIYFDYQAGPPWRRWPNLLTYRYRNRPPRILPFHQDLKGFDLIQTWELFTDWTEQALEAKAKWGMPVSVMVWDNIPFNMEAMDGYRARKERTLAEADHFIVHTDRSKRTLVIEGADPDKISVIDPGVDLKCFAPGPGDRAALGVDEDSFVILFVGWLLPRKGLDFLMLALRELLATSAIANKIQLVIVGSGPGRDRVDTLARRLEIEDHCHFVGTRPYGEMPTLFQTADVFVLPSIATDTWQEQFGMSLMESMASGTPVVTTHSGAIPEIVEDSALLCQPNDFFALYEALTRLIADSELEEECAEKGLAIARRRFDLDVYAQRLADLYARLVAR